MRLLGLLFLLAALGGLFWLDNRDGVLFNVLQNASSTPEASIDDGSDAKPTTQTGTAGKSDDALPAVTSEEIEKKVEEIYKELDEKEEDLRQLELRSPASSYVGMVTLNRGDAKATAVEKEYVIIEASSANGGPILISGWSLESYVTDREAEIPEGALYLKTHTTNTQEPIYLKPREQAYVSTSDTPLRTSFRENVCSGYLAEYGDFYPSLKKSCPLPPDEMLQFSSVKDSDDDCAEYVNTIKRCGIVDEDVLDDKDLTSACTSFIKNVLDYEGCVIKHDEDADFYTDGSWRIYLDRGRELWRSTREIIRLLDADGKVVDVLEY